MPWVIAIHTLVDAAGSHRRGSRVWIEDQEVAEEVVHRRAASWPQDETPVPPEIRAGLPSEFPGRAALEAVDIRSLDAVRAVADLTAIPGIGKATARKIAATLEEV